MELIRKGQLSAEEALEEKPSLPKLKQKFVNRLQRNVEHKLAIGVCKYGLDKLITQDMSFQR